MACAVGVGAAMQQPTRPGVDCNPSYKLGIDFHSAACATKLEYTAPYDASADQNSIKWTMQQLQTLNKAQIREILVDMLRREDELRLSSDCQAEFGRIGEAHYDFNSFVTALQAHVSLEFSVDPSVGVELIRSAVSLYPGDEEILQIPHYVRNNRCKAGNLEAGQVPPDCDLTDLEGNPLRLSNLLLKDRPVILMGASHT